MESSTVAVSPREVVSSSLVHNVDFVFYYIPNVLDTLIYVLILLIRAMLKKYLQVEDEATVRGDYGITC